MRGLPVEKDLVVDMEPFFDAYRAIKPYLITSGNPPTRERNQSQTDRIRYEDTTKCILCAACTTAVRSTGARVGTSGRPRSSTRTGSSSTAATREFRGSAMKKRRKRTKASGPCLPRPRRSSSKCTIKCYCHQPVRPRARFRALTAADHGWGIVAGPALVRISIESPWPWRRATPRGLHRGHRSWI